MSPPRFYPSISQRARRVKREGRVYDRLYATTRTSSRAKREAEDVQAPAACVRGVSSVYVVSDRTSPGTLARRWSHGLGICV